MTSIEFFWCSRLVDAERTKENVIEVEAGHTITNALAVETEEVPCAVHVENILYKVSFFQLIAICVLHHEVIRPFVKVLNSYELRNGLGECT